MLFRIRYQSRLIDIIHHNISDLTSENSSDNYDAAYVNTNAENGDMPGIYSKDIKENPYYETNADSKLENVSKPKSEAVNLEDTEIVTATKNIYYSWKEYSTPTNVYKIKLVNISYI